MAELMGKKKILTINLSLFTFNDQNSIKSCNPSKSSTTGKYPRNFEEPNGVVGLGIVAYLNEPDHAHDPSSLSSKSSRTAIFAVSPRSNPIPIFSRAPNPDSVKSSKDRVKEWTREEVELSEEYTCVISHVGKNLIKKREYFDCDLGDGCGRGGRSTTTTSWVTSGGVFSASSSPVMAEQELANGDFLSSCYLCKKQLHGLDIFMYRGEKAFCSAECRHNHMLADEHREKSGGGAVKAVNRSLPPCSARVQLVDGVAVA